MFLVLVLDLFSAVLWTPAQITSLQRWRQGIVVWREDLLTGEVLLPTDPEMQRRLVELEVYRERLEDELQSIYRQMEAIQLFLGMRARTPPEEE